MARISSSVRAPSSSIPSSAATAADGSVPASTRPAWAMITMADTWWATVSCSSRASCSRSRERTCSNCRSRAVTRNRTAAPTTPGSSPKTKPTTASTTGVPPVAAHSAHAATIVAPPSTISRPDPHRGSAYTSTSTTPAVYRPTGSRGAARSEATWSRVTEPNASVTVASGRVRRHRSSRHSRTANTTAAGRHTTCSRRVASSAAPARPAASSAQSRRTRAGASGGRGSVHRVRRSSRSTVPSLVTAPYRASAERTGRHSAPGPTDPRPAGRWRGAQQRGASASAAVQGRPTRWLEDPRCTRKPCCAWAQTPPATPGG